jgi:hypothetical protein
MSVSELGCFGQGRGKENELALIPYSHTLLAFGLAQWLGTTEKAILQ